MLLATYYLLAISLQVGARPVVDGCGGPDDDPRPPVKYTTQLYRSSRFAVFAAILLGIVPAVVAFSTLLSNGTVCVYVHMHRRAHEHA